MDSDLILNSLTNALKDKGKDIGIEVHSRCNGVIYFNNKYSCTLITGNNKCPPGISVIGSCGMAWFRLDDPDLIDKILNIITL